jgi:hypothetical protein
MKILFDIRNEKQIVELLSRDDLILSVETENSPNGTNILFAFFQKHKNGEQTLLDTTNLVIKPEGEKQ